MKSQNITNQLNRIEQILTIHQDKPLSFKEAAQYLNLSTSSLYKMTSSGKIAHFKPGGKKIFFLQSDLNSYIMRNKIKSDEEIGREADSSLLKNR